MRVHHLINRIDHQPAGAERIAQALHEGLLSRGVESKLVSMVRAARPNIQACCDLGATSPYSPSIVGRVARYLRSSCRPDDIIHAHLFPTNFYLSLACRTIRWQGPLVTTEHSTFNRRRNKLWGRCVDATLYPSYSAIYCISQATSDALREWRPGQSDAISVIENGATLRFPETPQRPRRSSVHILMLARLHPLKDYPTALRAVHLLLKKSLSKEAIHLTIAGDGEEKDRLLRLRDELGLEQHVEFCGHVADPSKLLFDADIFLTTSQWEGFGLSAVEAMNAGLPVVASSVAGLREVVGEDQECGILCPPDSPRAFATALAELANDRERRVALGKAGFKRSAGYSTERMINKYLEEYCKLSN